MRLRIVGSLFLTFWAAGFPLWGQSADFYPLDLIKPGQKAIGKTVFQGNAVETFEVEILGVLKNVGPKQNMILARLLGDQVRDTGVFAGMSGSPVYLENRLVGAVAYAFTFAKEPIAGITPIQETVDIFRERPQPVFHTEQRWSFRELSQAALFPESDFSDLPRRPAFPIDSVPGLLEGADLLAPIASPLNLSGFSPLSIQHFGPQLRALGLLPVRGLGSAQGSGDLAPAPLEPGSTVSVQLVRGDMDVSASGTVTHVSGDRIYAFGHPLLSLGYTDLPLHRASVVTVIPSLMSSQKVSSTGEFVGSIRQDRATGVMGIVGAKPKMIPVNLQLVTSRNEVKRYSYELITDKFLTPFLMTFTVHNSIVASERVIGGQTLNVRCTISLKDQPQVLFENSISDISSSPVFAALSAAAPVNFLLNSGFEDVEVEGIEIEITATEQTREAVLERVWQDRLEIRAGEEIEITVFLRKTNGEVLVEKYPVRIPETIPQGPLSIMVADGQSLIRDDSLAEPEDFVPQNLNQLVRAINNIKRNDRLYIRIFREQSGAVVAGEGLPGLPPSLLALYNSEKTSGEVRSIKRLTFLEYELPATPFVLKGQKVIRVNIKG